MDIALSSAAAAVVGAACAVAPIATRVLAQRDLARMCAAKRTLVLTYDDGPGAQMTPRVLDLLSDQRARASFFALGVHAAHYAAILDRALNEGHEVGNHSYAHVHPWRSAPWTSAVDMSRGFRALAPWASQHALFRPPHGKLTPVTWAAARLTDARIAWWTCDSGDSRLELPNMHELVAAVRRQQGGVVLMHDHHRDPVRSGYVLELTRRLLNAAREDGMRVLPLGELLFEPWGRR